jgi:hypothetical protein
MPDDSHDRAMEQSAWSIEHSGGHCSEKRGRRGGCERPSRRARHQSPASKRWQQMVRVARAGRASSFGLLLSDQARSILRRGYDAFTTDRAYASSPHGWMGRLGRAADRRVLAMPVHVALRERLAIVVGALERAIRGSTSKPVRVLSAPCGLIRDISTAAASVSDVTVLWIAQDLDDRGDVIPEAIRRSRASALDVAFVRGDLFDSKTENRLGRHGPFDVVSCIGLTAWIGLEEIGRLAGMFHRLLAPGGTLLIDVWGESTDSALARALELPVNYHDPLVFGRTLEREGFVVEERCSTSGEVNTLWILRRR